MNDSSDWHQPLNESDFRKDLTRKMNNECKSKHPEKAWFCEAEAFHPGNHFTYVGWGSNMKKLEWCRING